MRRYLSEFRGINENLGHILRATRKRRGVSQMELAEKIGVSYQQIQKYEYGSSQLTVSRLRQIAEALGVPVKIMFNCESAIADGNNCSCLSEKEKKVISLLRDADTDKAADIIINIVEDTLSLMNSQPQQCEKPGNNGNSSHGDN